MLNKDNTVSLDVTNQQEKGNIKKLSPSQLLFSDQTKAMTESSKATRVPVVIDREAFERTIQNFDINRKVLMLQITHCFFLIKFFQDSSADQRNLSELQLKKRDLICKIEYEIKQIENDIAESKSDSECEKRQNDTAENQEILNTSIQVIKENDKEELPAWMKLFLERSNKSKPSDEEVIPTVSGRTPNDDSDEITTPECCSKENEMIEVELHDTNEKCKNDDALKKACLQSKIKQLKDIFNVQTSKSPSSSKRVSHFISTQSIKEKFENNVKTQETKSLMKSPNKKLIDLSQYFNIETTDGTNKKPSEIEKMKWKYQEKPRDSNLQNFNLIEKADNINFDDINHEKVFRENVQKYLDLIDESETDNKMLSSKPLKKELPISQLDKSKLQDLFKDQEALTRSKTSKLMVTKLSKSLNFLNEPSSEIIGQTSKVKEELKKMSGAQTLSKDFLAVKESSQCEDLIKNRQGSIFFSERGLSAWWVIVVLTLSLTGISHFDVKAIVESQISICYVSNSLKSIIPHIPSHHLKYHLQDLNLLISQL